MANLGAYLVPTTVTYAALQREGVAAGMPAELVAKVGEAVQQVRRRGPPHQRVQAAGLCMAAGSPAPAQLIWDQGAAAVTQLQHHLDVLSSTHCASSPAPRNSRRVALAISLQPPQASG